MVLPLLAGCGTDIDSCTCVEETQAKLPTPISSEEEFVLTIEWEGGAATCTVSGTKADCDSNGTVDSMQEEGLVWFVTEVTDLDNDGQHVQIFPLIESVHVPGKWADIQLRFEDTDRVFATSGELKAERGSTGDCTNCDYWATTFVEETNAP